MTIPEILDLYRKSEIRFMIDNRLLDEVTMKKINILEKIFAESQCIDCKNDGIKILRMYYKDLTSVRCISRIIHVSERHVYRLRDACVDRLSDLLDHSPPRYD